MFDINSQLKWVSSLVKVREMIVTILDQEFLAE